MAHSSLESFRQAIRSMISISEQELQELYARCEARTYARKSFLSLPDEPVHEIFFITKGLVRVIITDSSGVEHTVHFALENQFIADYSGFLQQLHSVYSLQALEDTEVVVLPRTAIEWGYAHLTEGDRLGRYVAEYYFIYNDNRIKNLYALSPKERYDRIAEVFPNIHNRVPQHMIASYLGITPVHLSRLKRQEV